jgi:hypothetical protein
VLTVGVYQSVEDAEKDGEKLLAHGIAPIVDRATLEVHAEDYERAAEILGLNDLQEPPPPDPYQPCPNCGTPDPIWFGKRKAILLLAFTALVIASFKTHFIALISLTALLLFLIGIRKIPEFECRNCHRRWTDLPLKE